MRIGLFLLSAGWISTVSAMPPGDSALDFVSKLRDGTLDLEPGKHTAISVATGPDKVNRITQRLERLRQEIDGSDLEVGPVETNGDLAGVLIRSTNVADLSRLRVLPIALIRNKERWQIAPVLASFENTPVSSLRKYREGIEVIETWLAKESAAELERLEVVARKEVSKKLASIVSPEKLREASFSDVVGQFIKACSERDSRTILAMSGGLSETLPSDWMERSSTLRMAMSKDEAMQGAWPILLDPQNFLLPVMEHELSDTLHESHVVCLIPTSREDTAYECISLKARRSNDGIWVFDHPQIESSRRTLNSMLDLFPSKLQLRYPSSATETAEELTNQILMALENRQGKRWANFLHLDGSPEQQRTLCYRAAIKWSGIQDPEHPILPVVLETKAEASEAYLAIQWLSMNNLSFSPDILHLEKTEGGWLWNPMPSKEDAELAREWSTSRRDEWRENYQAKTIHHCPKADFDLKPVKKEAAEKAVRSWIDALTKRNWTAALASCAQLETPRTPKLLLRNLSADCKHIVRSQGRVVVVSSMTGKHLSLVGTRRANNNDPADLYVTVVPTAEGPRILQEIDLGNPERRGRAFLNRESIERLEDYHPDAAKDLSNLIDALAETN